jgi:hypothetical protein
MQLSDQTDLLQHAPTVLVDAWQCAHIDFDSLCIMSAAIPPKTVLSTTVLLPPFG